MSKKHYRPLQEEKEPLQYNTALPTHMPVANYYRQSTIAQVGNQSTSMQTVDMAAYLKQLGWAEENIISIDMDAGVSGTKKIDERPGMSQLFRLITTGQIGAVSCQDEDRLFRDVTQIQVNIFIEACRENRVVVITPSMVYNFHHEQMGSYSARQFRFKSEMAAEYITAYIRGRLQKAKRRVLMEGRWAGPPMPPGYMVDMRKTLPNGAPNPDWRKFVIFEPYAEVVREYWQLFIRFSGQIRPTVNYILEHGPYYPDPSTCEPPEGFKVVYRIRPYKGKRCPSRGGLTLMLTNALYVGHWMYRGSIAIWDNHPALIDQQTFMRAFDYLSKSDLNGTSNERFMPARVYSQPSRQEDRVEPLPLCAGLLYAKDLNGQSLRMGTRWSKTNNSYMFEHWSKVLDKELWCKRAAKVDTAVVDELRSRLSATFDFDEWENAVGLLNDKEQEEAALRESQAKQLKVVMDNLLVSLGTLTHPHMIRAVEKQYADAEEEMKRLQQEILNNQGKAVRPEQIRELQKTCGNVFENWQTMTRDEQREVIHFYLNRVDVEAGENHTWHLVLHWMDKKKTEVSVLSSAGLFRLWTAEDDQRLVTLTESETDQLVIASAFPDRSWSALQQRYAMLRPKTIKRLKPRTPVVQKYESYMDYMKRTGQECLALLEVPLDASKPTIHWTPDEDKRLVELMESDADQMAIVRTFPYRTWWAIKQHYWAVISVGRERERRILCVMDKHESYNEYVQRIAKEGKEGKNSLADREDDADSEKGSRVEPRISHQDGASDLRPPTQHG